ncbi:uracil-DNA glycosylase-like [Convolutriloba macropyga]|uniref:uracil-DNA glycosylase-like n=1 Tax=Convolutriloba macropyga TaxID=536237 RepID=UPI003F5241B2
MKRTSAKVAKQSVTTKQSNLKAFCSTGSEPGAKKMKPTNEPSPAILNNVKAMQSYSDLIEESWRKELAKELSSSYFQKLEEFVNKRRSNNQVFPVPEDVFSWSHFCPLSAVKVVIIGQDPYHDDNQAHGLCFSVKKGVPAPPSLKNIFKELGNEFPKEFKQPDHGELTNWAKQGVLLLNAVLTVDAHKANSHKSQGWEKFTDAVIRLVNKNCENVVYLLWGAPAQKKAECVDRSKNLVLKAVHPSPLSAHRGFFGCDHFKKCNEFLVQKKKTPIDWCKFD